MQEELIEPTDEQLLGRVRGGDSGALGLLYVRYSPQVYELALHFSGNEEEAEDISHNVFCRFWERHDQIADISSLKAYLFKMTRNEILTLFRHRQVERNYLRQKIEQDPSPVSDDNVRITAIELLQMINLAIDRMPDLRRRIFMMSRYDEMTYAEIAESLDISPRTVQYHIGKALAELRNLFHVMLLFM